MSDFIDRKKLLKKKQYSFQTEYGAFPRHDYFIKVSDIRSMPTVDTEKHAHWIKHKPNEEQMKAYHELGFGKAMDIKSTYWSCSNCNCWGTPVYKYCPNCGYKMDKNKIKEK